MRSAVKAAIDAVDVEGLLEGGAPEDEYAPEIQDLAGRIVAAGGVDRDLVRQVWSHWFGTPSRMTEEKADEVVRLVERRLAG
ncbi:hypothetical protein DP939_28480 [Spongiactinospora rosea]|uniref:Uncharacterized protein n=1 Tax=Spongiactinospora rosea TaxID=2248750 RepID=A0A366LSW9_9ACTN|nr:hypothetical protein DP939_28480 [Spongiactinospora rosea]